MLREAIAVDPGYVKAYNNLGFALLGRGDRRGAARAWRQSLALQPGQPRIARQLDALEGR